MALYEVTRTDEVHPGEFVSAYVLASGTAKARQRVAHLPGVVPKGTNVHAERLDTAKADALLSVYYDEREPERLVVVDDAPAAVGESFHEVGASPAPTSIPAPNFL
ncbi:hypothetical protein ACFU7T_19040 [Streptomyces sp. NPDC057555]|uniref:hypothetical protein n=1 Tax=Streptomyces sp. NPDC057555 TaxID=3346166 RepID=UPI0036CEC705